MSVSLQRFAEVNLLNDVWRVEDMRDWLADVGLERLADGRHVWRDVTPDEVAVIVGHFYPDGLLGYLRDLSTNTLIYSL